MFSENAAQSEARSMRDGNQVAGLMDIAKLLKHIGKSMPESEIKALAAQTQKFPRESYEDQKLFIDPMGKLMNDRGPTYVGRDIPAYGSLRQLAEEGQTLQDYLQGTEAADLFGPELSRFRFGIAPLPSNFEAGVTPPQGFVLPDTGDYRHLRDGFMVISSNMPKEKIGPLFEHEIQHVYQNALGMPRGTIVDEVSSNDFFDYLQSINSLTPARRKRIDDFAANTGMQKGYARYLSTTGEAEARAAAKRYVDQQSGLLARIPKPSDYIQNDLGVNIKPSMMYDIPQDTAEGYSDYRANLFKKVAK
jgi:hypothetical protein